MTTEDWRRVIDQTAELGGRAVTFIGGEPTLHPALDSLVRHALASSFDVEVYSNLARPIVEGLWRTLDLPRVRLATSYYATDAATHEAITQGPAGSHRLTRANIVEALRRGIPIRVGVVEVIDNQETEAAIAELKGLGVDEVEVDRLRQVGRGVRDREPSADQLCGRCAEGRLAVTPSGAVYPCVFARWLPLGNVRDTPLSAIAGSNHTQHVRAGLSAQFRAREAQGRDCTPDCSPFRSCRPDASCRPD
jgi:radical SAM protein with 4Fe4S-binding SPASM domain